MDPLTAISTRRTPQTEPADARQIPNAAGGYGFAIGDDARIHRFLTLGVAGGTYYATERELTKANAEVVLRAARERGQWLAEQIVAVSVAGRAPRQNPAIFALAAVTGLADDDGRAFALSMLPTVCRTGTHLFLFAKYVEQFRGWGRGLRRAVAGWYLNPSVDDVAYQVVKYRQREGWSHRDLLRLSHPKIPTISRSPGMHALSDEEVKDDARRVLFDWTTHPLKPSLGALEIIFREELENGPLILQAFERAQIATGAAEWVELIEQHPLSWEMLPDVALTEPKVWHGLIAKGMPQTALMRQLPRLTRLGVLTGSTRDAVVAQLTDPDRLRKARVHPVNVLVAQRTYASGHSARGESTWIPRRQIVDALDAAFYASFGSIEPAGKRTLIALDVSSSMTNPIPDQSQPANRKNSSQAYLPISSREASAALTLVTMATEPNVDIVGFASTGSRWTRGYSRNTGLTELAISPRQRLDDAIRAVSDLPFGGTDCALPLTWAEQNRREYDTVVILTDNESYAGPIHVHEALRQYRERVVADARLIVVSMTANNVSIVPADDPGSLDVAGFDSAVPGLLADFSAGRL